MLDDRVKTLCLELSSREACLLLFALRELKNDIADSVVRRSNASGMKEFELILGMLARIGVACNETGLVTADSAVELAIEIKERIEHDNKEDDTEKT